MADSPHVDIDDLAGWVEADRNLTAQIVALDLSKAELEQARDIVRDQLRERIGDAHEARIGGRPVITYRPAKAGTYLDQKSLKADHPELVEQYQKTKKAARPFVVLDPGTGA